VAIGIKQMDMIDFRPVMIVSGTPEQGDEVVGVLVTEVLRQPDKAHRFVKRIHRTRQQPRLLSADDDEGVGLAQAIEVLQGGSRGSEASVKTPERGDDIVASGVIVPADLLDLVGLVTRSVAEDLTTKRFIGSHMVQEMMGRK
jgi:hypothetical protein